MMFFSSGAAAAQELILAPIRPAPFAPYSLEDARACYAEAKRAGEALCQAWTQQYGVETRIVRPMHTYGYGMNLEGGWIHSDFIKDILAKRDLVISGDGMAGRAFCYITDAALAYFTVLIKGRAAHPYPVGTDTVIRMSELGQILADEFRLRVIIKKPIGDRPIPPMEPSPDISATTSLGWAPTTSIRDGFRRTVAAYRHELEGI
jgi:nucleoside-diphosphate-sugar epimerase